MKTGREIALFVSGACAAVLLVCVPIPAFSEVSVNINIGPPPVLVEGPPELIVVPRTMIYFAPSARADLFFYRGRWWTRHEGRWFRSNSYNGPWVVIGPRYVPVEIVRMPREYRTVYVREQRVPYGQLKRHWEHREYERRKRVGEWREHRGEHKGHGRGHGHD
jgi:hypothetical protein